MSNHRRKIPRDGTRSMIVLYVAIVIVVGLVAAVLMSGCQPSKCPRHQPRAGCSGA